MNTQERPLTLAHTAAAPEGEITWAVVAREFLQVHWQKLLLCLGVLLIVVSSTAGANYLLGPLLWRPEGKCLLALGYTLLFAAFGRRLMRWGAADAGRMVLLTTLAVIPVLFSLEGELRLAAAPSVTRLLVVSFTLLSMLGCCWLIVRSLGTHRGGLLPLALFGISLLNLFVEPEMPRGWELAAFLLPGGMYLPAIWRVNRAARLTLRRGGAGSLFLALGTLTYVYLFGVLRAGLSVLHLAPTLFAVPVMLIAVAVLDTASHGVSRRGTESTDGRTGVLRVVGHVLVGLAFALALARPAAPTALYSGNTLLTALMGLGLFAGALRSTRKPAYLYLAFAALFLVYFGAGYFIGDVMAEIDAAARRALGYREPLPFAFKSLNGVVFNLVLGGLALWFSRPWREERLAWHCHAIGLPVSLLACGLSCLVAKAAVLCLPAYAALYLLAAILFRQPRLLYLACAALALAGDFALILMTRIDTFDAWVLGAACLGLLYCVGGVWLCASRADYRRPLLHAAYAMAGIATCLAVVGGLTPIVALPLALTFGVISLVFILAGMAEPHPTLAALAVGAGALSVGLAAIYLDARFHLRCSWVQYAVFAASVGAVSVRLGEAMRRRAEGHVSETGRPGSIGFYPRPLFLLSQGAIVIATGMGMLSWVLASGSPSSAESGWVALSMGLASATWVRFSRMADRKRAYPYFAVVSGVAACGAAYVGGLTVVGIGVGPASLAIGCGTAAVILFLGSGRIGVSRDVRQRRTAVRQELYDRPLAEVSLALTLAAAPMALGSPAAMLLVAVAFLLQVRSFPSSAWLYPSLLLVGGAIGMRLLAWPPEAGWVSFGLVGTLVMWCLGLLLRRVRSSLCARLGVHELRYEEPCFHLSLLAAFAAFCLRYLGSLLQGEPWMAHPGMLEALAVFALLVLTRYRSHGWVHLAVVLSTASAAIRCTPLLAASDEVAHAAGWLVFGTAMAGVWHLLSRAVLRLEDHVARFGPGGGRRYSDVPRGWALVLLSLSSALLVGVVGMVGIEGGITGQVSYGDIGPVAWARIAVALGLSAIHWRRPPGRLWRCRLHGVHAIGVLMVWWLPVFGSTLLPTGFVAAYYPMMTATLALLTLTPETWLPWLMEPNRLRWPGEIDGEQAVLFCRYARGAAVVLAAAALLFTRGEVGFATAGTLLVLTVAAALYSMVHREVAAASIGGLLFVGVGLCLALSGARALEIEASSRMLLAGACGLIVPAFVLLGVASAVRRRGCAAERVLNEERVGEQRQAA